MNDAQTPSQWYLFSSNLSSVFIRILRGELEDLSLFALQPVPWIRDIRVISFALNTWVADIRLLEERIRDPKVLDVGWTEFSPPQSSTDICVMGARHIMIAENRLLNNRSSKKLVSSAFSKFVIA